MINVAYALKIEGNVNPNNGVSISGTVQCGSGTEHYTGPLTVTPSQSTQTLLTKDKTMTGNVTVNPIPSNYGLITWNGAYLTVS